MQIRTITINAACYLLIGLTLNACCVGYETDHIDSSQVGEAGASTANYSSAGIQDETALECHIACWVIPVLQVVTGSSGQEMYDGNWQVY